MTPRSSGLRCSRNSPAPTRDPSSRSSISRAMCIAWRWITSCWLARSVSSAFGCLSVAVAMRIAESGLRSACAAMATKLICRWCASSACACSFCAACAALTSWRFASSSSRRCASCSASGDSGRRAVATEMLGGRAHIGDGAVDDLAAERVASRARLLGAVHGGVGAVDERGGVGAVLGIDADAQAPRERERVRADLRRHGQRVDDLPRDRGGVARLRHLGEEDDELVAAVAAHRVRFAHRVLEAARRQLQHLVADRVTERIVDLLEVVEVEKDDADAGRAPLRHRDRVLEPVEHQRARRRTGQLVVLGRAGELVEAADGGLRRGVGVDRRLDELGVGLEHLRAAQLAQLVLDVGEVAPQAGQLGAHRVGLGVEEVPAIAAPMPASRRRRLRSWLKQGVAARSRSAFMMPQLMDATRPGRRAAGIAEKNGTYSRAMRFPRIPSPCRTAPFACRTAIGRRGGAAPGRERRRSRRPGHRRRRRHRPRHRRSPWRAAAAVSRSPTSTAPAWPKRPRRSKRSAPAPAAMRSTSPIAPRWRRCRRRCSRCTGGSTCSSTTPASRSAAPSSRSATKTSTG